MKVALIGWSRLQTTQRLIEAGERAGFQIDHFEIDDLIFSTEPAPGPDGSRLDDLIERSEALIIRSFYPNIAQALTAAQTFHREGRPVFDACLAVGGYLISKMYSYLELCRRGLPVPRTWRTGRPEEMVRIAGHLGYPVIVKGDQGGRGDHVHLANNAAELLAISDGYTHGELLLQEYLPGDRDYRVFVIGYETVPVVLERRAGPSDFRTNAPAGGTSTLQPLDRFPGMAELASSAARALGREFAGVDIRYRQGDPLLLEVNRQPNFVSFEERSGLDLGARFFEYTRKRINENDGTMDSNL